MSMAAYSHGNLTPSEIASYYTVRVPHLNQRGREWRGPCPIHDGKDDNFSVNAENGTWPLHGRVLRHVRFVQHQGAPAVRVLPQVGGGRGRVTDQRDVIRKAIEGPRLPQGAQAVRDRLHRDRLETG